MFLTKDISVTDDLFSQELKAELFETVYWMPMHFLNRYDRFKTHELDMHWYYPLVVTEKPYEENVESRLFALDDSLQSVKMVWQLIKDHLQVKLRLYECMISANTFGTEGKPHQDVFEDDVRAQHYTILVYCNKEWKMNWAGETLFFDAQGEVNAAVIPKPGRVLICKGDPVHVGRSVSRICPTDRRVLVFKAWLET